MAKRPLLYAEDLAAPSAQARGLAGEWARRMDVGLNLIYVEDLRGFGSSADVKKIQAWHVKNEADLKTAAEAVSAQPVLKSGSPAQELLKFVTGRPQVEAVLMKTRGHQGLKKFLLGSVTEEVVRNAKRPVMVFGPRLREDFGFSPDLRFLLATDLKKSSVPAETYALSLAKRLNARLNLFHSIWDQLQAVQEAVYMSGMVTFDLEATTAELRGEAETVLAKKIKQVRTQGLLCECRTHDQSHPAPDALLREAEKGYDLIVMGTRSRNFLVQSFLGSTAREIILQSPIPVMVVRS